MATKKNKDTEVLDFFEVLDKYRTSNTIDLEKIIKKGMNIFDLSRILDTVLLRVELIDSSDVVHYEVQKQYVKYYYGLLQCTSLEIKGKDYSLDNIDFEFEKILYDNSSTIRKLYDMIENMFRRKELLVIDELTTEFRNLPTLEEIGKLQDALDGLFKDREEGELAKIESILSYNDPSLKAVKDIIFDTKIKNEVSEETKEEINKIINNATPNKEKEKESDKNGGKKNI